MRGDGSGVTIPVRRKLMAALSQLLGDQEKDNPKRFKVIPLRHPWRWVSAVVITLIVIWAIQVLVSTPAFGWDVVGEFLLNDQILQGVWGTLYMTVLAVALGLSIGSLIAVMRLSPNPILSSVASFYQWFFRGTPVLVQLIFWYNLSSIFPNLRLSIFGWEIFNASTNTIMTSMTSALLGLGLNFGAYCSEIVRAGILSVDEGQIDASTAYGLTRLQTYKAVILPQAMRVILPPLGNEFIGMLKGTSLASTVAFYELLHQAQVIYNRSFQIVPLLVVASLWYLLLTSILSIGQHFIENRFARGTRRNPPPSIMRFLWNKLTGRSQRS
ncbi:amino acid ABC transporter permease [Arthrobacter bambusae]|uniref:amino acid ABC transporter permease n=1 Tax=Arthrobacter bambusae TaxID=1338426 RepID=UPI001F50B265|nr:amino acid ABC transporter permease [Arthrobacter bambusae]MCI0144090.1 amino acid ABC transporter permease [Arthrobacter bambusae]